MKLGDVIESAIWLSGEESEELRTFYEKDVEFAIATMCAQEGCLHGPVSFTEKHPEDDSVPQVPHHISGTRIRLLVAEAEVIGRKLENKPDSFVANLDRKDLVRLRKITRVAAAQGAGKLLNDAQCDEIIERYGPEAALDTLRRKDTLQ